MVSIFYFNQEITDLLSNKDELGLTIFLEKMYKKGIDIIIVDLKYIHLNSDVFSAAVSLTLRDRKNKAVRILIKAIIQITNILDLHTIRTMIALKR
jgi:hypothetical protein